MIGFAPKNGMRAIDLLQQKGANALVCEGEFGEREHDFGLGFDDFFQSIRATDDENEVFSALLHALVEESGEFEGCELFAALVEGNNIAVFGDIFDDFDCFFGFYEFAAGFCVTFRDFCFFEGYSFYIEKRLESFLVLSFGFLKKGVLGFAYLDDSDFHEAVLGVRGELSVVLVVC